MGDVTAAPAAPAPAAQSGALSLEDDQVYGVMVQGIILAVWLTYVVPLFGKMFKENPISKLRKRTKALFTFGGDSDGDGQITN